MKIAVKILKILTILTGAVLTTLYFIPGSGFPKILSYLATIGLAFGMDLFRLIGLKVSLRFELAYLVFLIPAMIVGIDFDVYKIIYPFDKIVHGCSGILAAFAAREFIDQTSAKSSQLWFKALWSIAFVALTAVLWECFEFACDQIGGMSMQELIAPGVEDTMYDIIVAMIGGLIGTVMVFPIRQKKRN